MNFHQEDWERIIFEALRPIDPSALFNVSMAELDFRDLSGQTPEEFPDSELAQFVNDWLQTLDPDGDEGVVGWTGGGVRIVLRARGRSASWRGWEGVPSFNLLEPKLDDLHFTSGETRRLIDLGQDEIARLGSGELKLVGEGPSYCETFSALHHEMRTLGWNSMADAPTSVIQSYAGMLGLISGPPGLGNFDLTWRNLNQEPPNS